MIMQLIRHLSGANVSAHPRSQTPEPVSMLLLLPTAVQDETGLALAKPAAPSPNGDTDAGEFTLHGTTPTSHLARCPRALFSKLHLGQVSTRRAR